MAEHWIVAPAVGGSNPLGHPHTLSYSERLVPMSTHCAPMFIGLFFKLHRVPRIAIEPWPAIGRCALPSEPAGNGQAVVA